mgnify:CR=1 FL=1
MAKIIQVSSDSGVTWYTLPGGTGDLSRDSTPVTDTVFGQTYESRDIGLLGWKVSANAFYKGYTGYTCKIRQQGSTTAFTTEACALVSGKTYQISAATKEIWDRGTTVTVFDNAVDKTTEVLSIDYLFGKVTFKSTYTPTGPITASGKYFPTAIIGLPQSYTLTQAANAEETTDFATAQGNSGYRTYSPGLRQVSLEIGNTYALASTFAAILAARSQIIIEVNPDGGLLSLCRGYFKLASESQSGDVGALEAESISLVLNVPDPSGTNPPEIPFGWQHASTTTLSTALTKVLNAWESESTIDVQYLSDGLAGDKGTSIVTEVSLTGGLDSMNEFSLAFQGSGTITVV